MSESQQPNPNIGPMNPPYPGDPFPPPYPMPAEVAAVAPSTGEVVLPTTEEVMESLTGFDEIGIARQFGSEILQLAEHRPTAYARALVWILERRAGKTDAEAYQAVQEMSLRAVQEHFADDADDDLETAGKGRHAGVNRGTPPQS